MSDKIEKLIEYIDPEKLPWDYQELINIVGLETALQIAERCGGTYMYLEKLEFILMDAVRKYVLYKASSRSDEEFNVRQVARDLDVSQDLVYKILREKNKKEDDGAGWKQETFI